MLGKCSELHPKPLVFLRLQNIKILTALAELEDECHQPEMDTVTDGTLLLPN